MNNRAVIFAHYDKDNLIDDYVIFYLKELTKISNKIVFVSDCNLSEKELLKLKDITYCNIAIKHCEYDWGSYKKGYVYLMHNNLLKDIDEIILCNDSVYGPIFPLTNYVERMSSFQCDFSGFYQNDYDEYENYGYSHIQSWFLLLKKNVFLSNEFKNFMLNIGKCNNKKEIVKKYEIGFSMEMAKKFSYKCLYESNIANCTYIIPIKMIHNGLPFCKVQAVTRYNIMLYFKYKHIELYRLIQQHQRRCCKKNLFINLIRSIKHLNLTIQSKIIKN